LLTASGRWDEGILEMMASVRLEPSIAIFRNTLADALMAVGRFDDALQELRAALDADARYQAARVRALRCYEKLGRFEEAIAERRALGDGGLADEFQKLFRGRGVQGYKDGRTAEVSRMIEAARMTLRAPASVQRASDILNPPELRLALACADVGDWDGARQWRDRACRSRPGRRPWFDSRPELAAIGTND
jgi:tetratricopeptide (TPR) repeat protein